MNEVIANNTSPPKATLREWVGLAVLSLAAVLYVMDLTVLHLAVPALSADLKPTSAQLLWIIDIYGFLVAGFLITMGTLGDRVGRRKLLLIGAAAFGATSLLAAFSRSAEMLIGARALLGISGATLGPSTLSLIFNMFLDPKQRSVAISVWISAFSAGSAIGPIVGGMLLQYFWWGSVFLLAVPVMALLLLLGPIVLREYRAPDQGRLDLVSVALSLFAVLALIFALKQIAQDGIGWLPISFILAGLIVGAAFVRRQFALADPMLDLRLFRLPRFSASLAVNLLTVFVAFGYFLFVAQFLQLVVGLSPFRAGLYSLPSAIGFIIGSNVIPRIVSGIRPAYVIGACLGLAAIGLAVLTQVGGADGLALVVAGSIIISLALAPVFGLTTELIVGASPPERAGAASGIGETAGELGGALGISILGSLGVALYRSGLSDALPAGVPPEAAAVARDTLGAATEVARSLPAGIGAALIEVAQNSFVQGMQVAAAVSAIVAVGAAILCMVMLRNVQSVGVGAEAESTPDPRQEGHPASHLGPAAASAKR